MTEAQKVRAISVGLFEGHIDGVIGFALSASTGGENGDVLTLAIRASHLGKDEIADLLKAAHHALTSDDRFEIDTTERFPQ